MSRISIKRFASAAALAAAAALLLAPGASAHGGNPNFRSIFTGFTPKIPGLNVQVIGYDSYMQLTNKTGKTVTIFGYSPGDEPVARVLANGTVQTNQKSPSLYLDADRYAEAPVPSSANAKAPPVWKTLDKSGEYTWHDHRMHWMALTTPPQVHNTHQKTKIFDYKIPLQVGTRRATLDGTLYWVGPSNTSKLPFIIITVLLLIALIVAEVVRRRRRGGGSGTKAKPAKAGKEAW